jgi:uncharacterized protein (DUF2267 family)
MTTMTGLDVFDNTIHKTNTWLKEIMEELGIDSRHEAYQALRGTLHTLRDRLIIEEAAQLGAQLPMLVTGVYYEPWDPTGKPIKMRHKDEFLEQVSGAFGRTSDLDAEKAARAVFRVMSRRVSEGEMRDIASLLPAELRELWPEDVRP